MKGQVLKMVSNNCQGRNMKEKRGDVLNYLYSKDYNNYYLQDAHFVEQDEVQIKNQWQGECILIHLHLTREVLLYFSKVTLNLKLTKLKKMIMTTFLDSTLILKTIALLKSIFLVQMWTLTVSIIKWQM